MGSFLTLLALLLFIAGSSSTSWSGPSMSFVRPNSIPQLRIGIQDTPPLWLTIHTTYKTPSELANMDTQVLGAKQANISTVCICLTKDDIDPAVPSSSAAPWFDDQHPLDNQTRLIIDRVIGLHPDVTLIIRYYAALPTIAFENITLINLNGDSIVDNAINSPVKKWSQEAALKSKAMLSYLDKEYPNRIGGAFPCFLHTSEWFLPGPGDFSTSFKAAPMYYSDYSKSMQAAFCEIESKTNTSNVTKPCAAPTPAERNQGLHGNIFTNPRAAAYNTFLASAVTSAMKDIAFAVKSVSAGKLMTVFFYGYLFALADARLTGSGHLALHDVLDSPDIDVVASPYQYLPTVRKPSGIYSTHGPMSAAFTAGKIWIGEDDSRTSLAAPGISLKYCNTSEDNANLLRRNVYSAIMHSSALYFYDLAAQGWFGRHDEAAATAYLWGNISMAVQQVQTIASSPTNPIFSLWPQVLVLVDDVSMGTTTLTGFNVQGNEMLLKTLPSTLGVCGFPVRYALVRDVCNPSPLLENARLVIFANAFILSSEIQSCVQENVHQKGKTVAYVYAPGVFSTSDTEILNVTNMASLTGFPIYQGSGQRDISIVLQNSTSGNFSWPPDAHGTDLEYLIEPWFFVNESTLPQDVNVIGRYRTQPHLASLLYRKSQTHQSFYIAAPGLSSEAWRRIAEQAGVHVYSSNEWTRDVLDVTNRFVLVHAGSQGNPSTRKITLPMVAPYVRNMETGETVCNLCSTFTTKPLLAGEVALFSLSQR